MVSVLLKLICPDIKRRKEICFGMEVNVKERITKYLKYMDDLLEQLKADNKGNLDEIMKNHMIQIEFFMHERLIHLIVTVLFAVGTFMTVFTYLIVENMGLLLLAFMLIVLLAPYIKHYYLLENGVQKMYKQYDILLELMKKK